MIVTIALGVILGYLLLVYGVPLIIAGAFFLIAGICWCFNQIADAIKWFVKHLYN